MKSKIDQRSPSRFSTGVPVSAMRARASSCLTALVCLAPGFLIACASSRRRGRHGMAPARGARQRAVAGDDQIDAGEPLADRAPSAPRRHRRGCATSAARSGAKRAISAPSWRAARPAPPAGWAPRGLRRSRPVALARSSSASTWIVLPRPMSSARQAPRPSDESRCSQRTPACWYGRSVAFSASPGSTRASRLGMAQASSVSASHGPATTRDQSAAASMRRRPRRARRRAGASPRRS
jgi:hypothetical protein